MHRSSPHRFIALAALILCVATSIVRAQDDTEIDASRFVNFFSLPFDTAHASPAAMREIRAAEGLRYIDYAIGKGDTSATGKRHFIRFFGTHVNGQPFDTSYCGSKVYSFVLGTDEIVKGLEMGLRGMREGGRRQIIVPPALAYGLPGYPSAGIISNETLIFYVELEKVE